MTRRPDENAAWRALRKSLTEDGQAHPAEEVLLAYTDQRSSLAADVAANVEAHLAECASCRDEVGVLAVTTIWPSRVMAPTRGRAKDFTWQRILAAVSRPAWRPALALAVLVLLMVPTLRLIGQDRVLRMDSVVQRRDNAMIVKEVRPQQPSRTVAPTAPAPSAKGSQGASAQHLPPAAPVKPAPSSTPPPRIEDSLTNERRMLAARERESRSLDASSARAMTNQLAVASPPAVPTVDYVPGGRVSIASGHAERVMLRVKFVRDASRAMDMRSDRAMLSEVASGVVLAPTVSEVEVVVIAADGRRNSRHVDIGAGQQAPTASIVDIPLDWLAAGENRVDIVSREDRPRSVATSFVMTLQAPD